MVNILTPERMKEVLEYNSETGLFTWKVVISNKALGSIAGHRRPNGYITIILDRKHYLAHRLAWFYMTGAWPKDQIDHKNLDKSDNRFSNLREATGTENKLNKRVHSNNKLGVKGVQLDKRINRYSVRFMNKHVGNYTTLVEASAAYEKAAKEFSPEFSRAA